MTFFEGDNMEDLNELFDTLARSPVEFLTWLHIAAFRLPETERFGFVVGVATALWGYVANYDFDDDIVEEANSRIVDSMRASLPREVLAPLNRRRLVGGDHDASSPFNFFGHRAAEEAHERQEVKPS